tara:strand:+ start:4822 stop:5274 length:453 start_codon:yes stop_codon:yes gene_type:complete
MLAGCEFTCKNPECEHFESGLTMTSPWPIGDIDLVIDACVFDEFKEKLIERKTNGRKYAQIQFPDTIKVAVAGYRISFWSPEGKTIWAYDIMATDLEDIDKKIANDLSIPKKCPTTDGELLNFSEAIDKGITCTSCKVATIQNRWFTNEN